MKTRTATAIVDAPAGRAFDYLSRIENLPEWANEFARELARDDRGRWVVRNNLGEFLFEIRADPDTGVIDMLAGPSEQELALFPTRVVALPDGRSAYTFTMFQAPGMPDELFESQHASLVRELENVRQQLEA